MSRIFILLGLCVSLTGACNRHGKVIMKIRIDSLRHTLEHLSNGFKAGSLEQVQTCLSEDFSISIASQPAARRYLEPLLEKNAITSIEFVRMDSFNNRTIWTTADINGIRGATQSVVALDTNYKVQYIDYLDMLYGHSRCDAVQQRAVLPFTFEDSAIVVMLKVNDNGAPLRFLFDTGADGMAMRRSLADSLHIKAAGSSDAGFVGGRRQIPVSSGNRVALSDSFALENQNIALFERIRRGFDGIIGLNLAANHIVSVDFDRMEITLSTFGRYTPAADAQMLAVSVPYGVLLAPCTLNLTGSKEVDGRFIFDTGAAYDFIGFSGFVRSNRLLLSGFKPENESATQSMGHSSVVYHGRAHAFSLSPALTYENLPVALQSSTSKHDSERTPDGSIGIGLISRFNFTIDLLQKRLWLQRRK